MRNASEPSPTGVTRLMGVKRPNDASSPSLRTSPATYTISAAPAVGPAATAIP